MKRAQKPIKLTAGNYMTLTLDNFVGVSVTMKVLKVLSCFCEIKNITLKLTKTSRSAAFVYRFNYAVSINIVCIYSHDDI